MAIGYTVGLRVPLARPRSITMIAKTLYDRRLFTVFLNLALAAFILTVIGAVISKGINLDPSSIGTTYNQGYKHYEKDSGQYSISFIMNSILAAPTFIVTVWGIYYFKTFRIWTQVPILLIAVGSPIIFTLSLGTQERTGHLLAYVSALFIVKATNRGHALKFRTIAIVSSIVLIGVITMMNILGQRYAAAAINALNINKVDLAVVHFNINHPIYSLLGQNSGFIFSELCLYLTNGIVGLSYALHTPFTWSFMFGTSYSMSVIGERLLGLPFAYLYTYPYMAAQYTGWGEQRWYTVFAWFASDFTFVGTIPLFGFFAFIYARSWIESIRFENPFSILLFTYLSLGVVMMTANNQLMAAPSGISTLGLVVFLYLKFHRRYNRRLVVA